MPTLEIAGWKASYQESGIGLPIVFVPGLTEYKESFQFQLRGLSDRYRVIAYDVRPASPTTPNYDIDVLTNDLGKLLDSLRIPSAVIAGHSFGGLIAQRFAHLHPERTTALVLISTFSKAPLHWQGKLLRYMSASHLDEPDSFWARLMLSMGFAKPKEYEEDDFLGWVKLQAAKTSHETVAARIKVVKQFDSRSFLDSFWMPVLLAVGQHDHAPFLAAAQMIERFAPDSLLEVIEGTGHFPHIERHDLLNYAIDDFIGSRLSALID